MVIALGFNPAQVEPSTGRSVFPEGEYNVIVSEAAQKATADNSGGMLVLTFKAIDGPVQGQSIQQFYNLWNKSAQAVEIAQREISAIAHCIGRPGAQNAQDLFNVPFRIRVAIEEGQKGKLNRITMYMDANGNDAKNAGKPAAAADASTGNNGGGNQAWGGGDAAKAAEQQQQAAWTPGGGAAAQGGENKAPWGSN